MKIPNKIRIAGVDYETVYTENLNDGCNMLYGCIDYDKSKISFNSTIKVEHQHKCQTYLHEILHGIEHHYGIKLPNDSKEEIIDKFATGLYQVLQDNIRNLFELKEGEEVVGLSTQQDGSTT